MKVRFDDSLSTFVDMVKSEFGTTATEHSVFVRDTTGHLSVVVDKEIAERRLSSLNSKAASVLGGYARNVNCIRDRSGPGSKRLLEIESPRRIRIGDQSIVFIDRRMVGADWMLPPRQNATIPRIAFVSIKGGVGRSTALAVMAAHFSTRGLRVLAIDLDLEAPGIGTMLLSSEAMPKYGTLDYLVENGISGIDEEFLDNVTGKSFLGAGGGQVTVLPAFGSETLKHPAGGLGKIARAYLEDVKPGGGTVSLTDQIREMIERFEATRAYDVVLVDGRAGLHETTAAVVLGLGAEILLFGVDEPQTFIGYNLLLSHLACCEGAEYEEWRQRIQFVNAKASADPRLQEESQNKFKDLVGVFDAATNPRIPSLFEESALTADDFDLEWAGDNEDVVSEIVGEETTIIRILDDERYRLFDPVRQPTLLTSDLFNITFGELLLWADNVAFRDRA